MKKHHDIASIVRKLEAALAFRAGHRPTASERFWSLVREMYQPEMAAPGRCADARLLTGPSTPEGQKHA
jgi:hypothetical protein